MQAIFDVHSQTLQDLYIQHADEVGHLGFSEFLKFAKRHNLCPSLLSHIECSDIFHSCKLEESQPFITYRGFLSVLARCALALFSGPEWEIQYPDSGHKLQLLLFWMDQSSNLFKGNGDSLQHQKIPPVCRSTTVLHTISFYCTK